MKQSAFILGSVATLSVAVFAIITLSRAADATRQGETLLAELESHAHQLSTLEWKSIGAKTVDIETFHDLLVVRRGLYATCDELERLDPLQTGLRGVLTALGGYTAAVDKEFALLQAGQIEEALEVDEEQVDPAFKLFIESIAKAKARSREKATLTIRAADAGLVAVVLLTAGVLGILSWQATLSRAVALRALDQQVKLENSNSALQREMEERKAAEAERNRLQSQLWQAQKMEAVGVLAGGIAHDFNNLLAAIIGHSRLAQKHTPEDSRARKNLESVMQAGDRAKRLIKQLLMFSKQDDQRCELVDVAQIVEESLVLLSASVPAMVRITTDLEPGCPLVAVDATRMQQVIVNLCTNSYHAIGDRTGEIAIRLRNVATDEPIPIFGGTLAPGCYLELTISDTGKGMDEETQARIFEPFFTTKELGEGTGLGLAVVHGIISVARGGMRVESRPGHGTIFRIYLQPCVDAPVAREAHVKEEDSKDALSSAV